MTAVVHRRSNVRLLKLLLIAELFLIFTSCSNKAGSQGLQTIDNPTGGKIVYGKVDGQDSEAGAMAAVLRSLHTQYGDRPQVGKVFHVRGTHSVAAFFTLVERNQGNVKLAGMLIACKVSDHVETALLTDDAARFGSTVNPMLTTLFKEWHPGRDSSSTPSAPAASSAQSAALQPYTLPDRSASVALPQGWKVLPSSGGGTIMAEGPSGEAATLGYPYLASDTNNPSVRQTMATLQRGGLRNTAYAKALYYPYGGDLGKTFVDLVQMSRQHQGQEPISIKIASETPMPGRVRCAHLLGQIDPKDGKGVREMNTVFCTSPPGRFGGYMNLAYHTAVPVSLAGNERATMGAILASFSVNNAVVQQQANAIAAPAIAQIHEIGRRAAQQAASAHAAEDAHNASVEKMWDERDKTNQGFSNYLLEQTVIQDNEKGTHSTEWNATADAMVKNNPQRYEYVPNQNFWKGVDY
jgi:hypothetical protein